MARAMGTNAYGKEPRRGERTLSRGFTHRRARRAFLRPYGAGASLGRSHRAYALGYFLAPLTGLRTAHAQDWHDAKNSASRRRRGLKCRNSRAGGPRGYLAGHARFLAGISRPEGGSRELPTRRTLSFGRSTSHAEARSLARREKSQQIGVHFVLVGRAQAVRRAWIGFQRGPFDQLGREQGRGADRHDLVVVAVDDESGYVEPLEILGEVRLRERFDAVEDAFETGLHALQPERVPQSLRDLGARPVGAVERPAEILEKLRSVGEDIGADTVEHLDRQAAGIGRRLEHHGASAGARRRSAQPWPRASCRGGRYSGQLRRRPSNGRRGSRASRRAFRRASRGHRRRCPYRCRSRAGWTGHDRGGRGRSSGIRGRPEIPFGRPTRRLSAASHG